MIDFVGSRFITMESNDRKLYRINSVDESMRNLSDLPVSTKPKIILGRAIFEVWYGLTGLDFSNANRCIHKLSSK
jgi:hypothetical protein